IEKRVETRQVRHARLMNGLPDLEHFLAGFFARTFGETGCERDCVDRASARGADPAKAQRLVFEKAIENAPCEGAVRTAALKGEIYVGQFPQIVLLPARGRRRHKPTRLLSIINPAGKPVSSVPRHNDHALGCFGHSALKQMAAICACSKR